jgi:serine protease Do
VLRDGVRKTLSVTIEEQPRDFAAAAGSNSEKPEREFGPTVLDQTGIKVIDLDAERAKEFGYPEKTEGVLIVDVETDSMAACAGLTNGALILRVDEVRTKTVEQVRQALTKGSFDKGVMLQIKTPRGGTTYAVLKTGG